MIETISLSSFKRFRELSLPLGQLTVLTGLNGSGKSTVVQALLLAHQASLDDGLTVPLVASPGLDLGQAADVLNVEADGTEITICIEDGIRHVWVFDTGPAGQDDLPYLRVVSRPNVPPLPLGSAGSQFTFLSAERLGPRTSHPAAAFRPDDAVVGEDGRFVAHALAIGLRREVPAARRHPDAGNVSTLGAQTEAWLSQLFGPTQLDASLVPRTSIATLRIRTSGRMGEWMLPTNTGFGISYALPVIVAGLLMPPGGLLMVDSPEAHLHPAAQSALAVFLATVAASDVQVVVETHSDHVLNGFRKAVAVSHTIHPQAVQIVFFGEQPLPAVLTLSERGSVSDWPIGFFDQFEVDLGQLTRQRHS